MTSLHFCRAVLPLALLVLQLCWGAGSGKSHTHFSRDFAVASYLPEWRYEGANWDEMCAHSTHLILFSLEPTPSGGIQAMDRLPRPELLAQAQAAATLHGTKVLICFGYVLFAFYCR